MNLRDLNYLLAVETHRHFGKAAKASFVSQPTLSMQIKKLEDSLGVTLIERSNKNVMLTPMGKKIARLAKEILSRVEQMKDIAKSEQNPFAGEIRIGIIPTVAPYLLPLIMPALNKKFPALTIFLLEQQTKHLVHNLQEGSIDAGILALPIPEENLIHADLYSETFLLAVPKQHEFAHKKQIKQAELEDKTILLLEEGHCLRDQALELCQTALAHEAHNFQATSLETLRHMVAAGVGITLMPELACAKGEAHIAYIPFNKNKPKRQIALFWRKSSVREILLHELTKLIKATMQHHFNHK